MYHDRLVPVNKDNVLFNIREDKNIHLGIPANILCIDDRLEPRALSYEVLEYFSKKPKLIIQDFSATLYLGKITFAKNKQGNLAPIYIPSQITESSFEGLNTFWLNEINPNAKKPTQSIMKCEYAGLERILSCEGSAQSIPHQKIYYYRSKDNIVLSKEQIISYFTELHTLNTTFIQNYIDSINKDEGIKASYLHSELYKDLFQQGVLTKDMLGVDATGIYAKSKQVILLALDYLKSTNQYNSMILFFDELFYAYLVWSLQEYLIPYYHGRYQDEYKLIFNAGAYKKTGITSQSSDTIIPNPYEAEIPKKTHRYVMSAFYSNILPTKYAEGYVEGYELFFVKPNSGLLPDRNGLPKSVGYKFFSPNQVTIDILYDKKVPPNFHTYIPSPLGNYYFELEDSKNTFVEYYQRIYPSIKNPPKGWSKEMMKKLELRLE